MSVSIPFFKPPNQDDILTVRVRIRIATEVLRFYLYMYSNEGYDLGVSKFVGWVDKKVDNNKPILFDTGKLKGSFKITYTDKGFDISNDTEYAIYLQNGVPEKNIPARPILYASESVNKIVDEIMIEEVELFYSNKNNYLK